MGDAWKWNSLDLGFINSDQMENPILSSVRQLLQNISSQYYTHTTTGNNNGSSLLNFDLLNVSASQEVMSEMGNTPSYEFVVTSLLYLQYLLTLTIALIGGWLVNRSTLKSDIVTHMLETVISILIFTPGLPAIFTFFLAIIFIRVVISLYLRVLHPDGKISLLTAVDSFWAYEEFASTSTCIGLYIIEGPCEPSTIRANMKKTIESELVGGKMNRKLSSIFGFSCWETIPLQEMDMEEYVSVVGEKGDENGNDKERGEQDVFEVMKNLQDKPIRGKAPWQVVVLPNFVYENSIEKKKCYAVIYQMHHAIMDGISSGNILHSVMADKQFKFSVDPTEPLGLKKPKTWQTVILYTLGFISMPRVGLRNLFLFDNQKTQNYTPGTQLTGPKTFAWTKPIKIEALKRIKNETKTSVYSVLLSSLGGAFRQFLLKNGEPLPENLHSMSPIALLPYPDRKPRNGFTGVIVPTNVGGKEASSPVQRLQKNYHTVKELGSSSATFLAIGSWYYPVLLGCMPIWLHKPMSVFIHVRMSLSNVPGPSEDVWIYGGKIVDIGIWVPIKYSVGFGMGLFSYKDRVRATIMSDHVYFSNENDVPYLTKAFEQELTLLGKSIGLSDVFFE